MYNQDGISLLRLMATANLPAYLHELELRPKQAGDTETIYSQICRDLDWEISADGEGSKYRYVLNCDNKELAKLVLNILERLYGREKVKVVSSCECDVELKDGLLVTHALELIKAISHHFIDALDNNMALLYEVLNPVERARTGNGIIEPSDKKLIQQPNLQLALLETVPSESPKIEKLIKNIITSQGPKLGCKPKAFYRKDWREQLQVKIDPKRRSAYVAGLNTPDAIQRAASLFNGAYYSKKHAVAHHEWEENRFR